MEDFYVKIIFKICPQQLRFIWKSMSMFGVRNDTKTCKLLQTYLGFQKYLGQDTIHTILGKLKKIKKTLKLDYTKVET